MQSRTRLAPETFEIPLAEIRRGYRSAIYFNRTKHIVTQENIGNDVSMQVFNKKKAILCGMDEALAVIQRCAGHWKNPVIAERVFDRYMRAKLDLRADRFDVDLARWLVRLEEELDTLWVPTYEGLDIRALYDGDEIDPWETVLRITGDYAEFAHLESVYLGILARATRVATNTHRVVEAAASRPVYFFADRFDRWETQGSDGYAAYIGGAQGVASDAMAAWWGEHGMGTMPHALIACFKGRTEDAAMAFNKHYPDTNLVALVDFNNDSVDDALRCLKDLGDKLWGIRLDTSESVMDPSVLDHPDYGSMKPTGVNPMLVEAVRAKLDHYGGEHVKILVSGGFNTDKISEFEAMHVPVDGYCVGSSLLAGQYDFTADIVYPTSKVGRKDRPNPRMEDFA